MKTTTTLSDNQKLVLSIGAIFHVINEEFAHGWLPELSANAMHKLFRRIVKAKMLLRYSYGDRERYFVLSRRAVHLLDLPPRRVGPLGWPALIQAIGVLGACVAASLEKLSAADFAKHFPELCPKRGTQTNYYALTPDDGLAWIIVDHGANCFTLAKKIQKLVVKRYSVPAFQRLIIDGGLLIVLATATPEKAAEIEAALQKEPPRFVRVQVVVVPQLISLIIAKGKK